MSSSIMDDLIAASKRDEEPDRTKCRARHCTHSTSESLAEWAARVGIEVQR
jgi:hypothetical protein